MAKLSITPQEAFKRFNGIEEQIITVCRHANGDLDKLLFEWVKTDKITLRQFKRLQGIIAYINEMGTLPESG
jgi:hypothetical protein